MSPIGTGLIDFLLHPPLGLMNPRLDYLGPYSGNVTLTQYSVTPGPVFEYHQVRDSYGILVQLNGPIPTKWGYEIGWYSDDGQYDESQFWPPLAQIVIQHQFLGGAWVTSQMDVVRSFPQLVLWQQSLPGRVGLSIAPGITLDIFYLSTGFA